MSIWAFRGAFEMMNVMTVPAHGAFMRVNEKYFSFALGTLWSYL